MKTVLFCGGLGTRMRGAQNNLPKPLVEIGGVALLDWVMRYYAHHGHTDFILCLGYRPEAFTEHFRKAGAQFLPTISGDQPAVSLRLEHETPWNVRLVDTGLDTSIGQRLKLVERYLDGESLFLANYSDGLTDLNLPDVIEQMQRRPWLVGAMTAVKPIQSFHYVHSGPDGVVTGIDPSPRTDLRINGGYFVFRQDIFRYLEDGGDLLEGSFDRLADEGRLLAHRHDGFWRACDTLKDIQCLEASWTSGEAPWEIVPRGPMPEAARA